MALPILDGNQTAATLSTIITGGAHIPAHTVVSLGSQAISDITSGVSGSVVSISNFPSTQTIAGTVTANFGGIASGVTIPVRIFAEAEGGPTSGQDTLVLCDAGGQLLVNAKSGGASVLGYDGNAFVQVKQVSGSSVTIGSLPAISGTVTANGFDFNNSTYNPIPIAPFDETVGGGKAVVAKIIDDSGSGLNFSAGVPISGTVTVSNFPETQRIGYLGPGGNTYVAYNQGLPVDIVSIQTNVNPLPISGTVTANNPSGALTTRFGSVTTANTAQITSAVTNTNRKYLLAQNISAGTVTIGIGFSPTTTQGIQLTAGGGLTFDAFCPTGAVYWLGAVTGAAFTILEG